jgi:hypothetical protein
MRSDFFDELEGELADLTRQGAHLGGGEHSHRRHAQVVRRGVVGALLVVALAVSLVSEFPASASGHAQAARALIAVRL